MTGLGSVLGPIIGMSVMERFAIDGVFYLMAATAFLLALLAGGRSLVSASPIHHELSRSSPRKLHLSRTTRCALPTSIRRGHRRGQAGLDDRNSGRDRRPPQRRTRIRYEEKLARIRK